MKTSSLVSALLALATVAVASPLVRIHTSLGIIEAELYADKAPATVANFLKYVDAGRYTGGQFHRTVTLHPDNQPNNTVKIEVIQGGVNPEFAENDWPAIALERTRDTGLKHLDGTLSMARAGPDTATSDFFVCVGDQPELDFGGKRNPDGQGFAAFGRVTKGLDIVRKIQTASADGQKLTPSIRIIKIERLSAQPPPPLTPYEQEPIIFNQKPWDNSYDRLMLKELEEIIRFDLSDSTIERISRLIETRRGALDAIQSQITAAKEYLSRHPSADLASVLEKRKAEYDHDQNEYEAMVKYFEPYQAEYIVEAQRSATRRSKFKELILSFAKLQSIPQESILDTAECVFYVDSAVLKNGQLTLHSHLSILPNNKLKTQDHGGYMDRKYSKIASLQVHAFVNGQNLGHVETNSDEAFSYSGDFKAGRRFEYSHVINVDDISIPPIGDIELSVDGGEYIHGKIRVTYTGSEQHKVKAGNAIIIRGRRDGEHLFMPVRFRVGGQDLTRECLVDTGATLTTVPRSVIQISTQEKQRFSTANGVITVPIAESTVAVGEIEKDIKIALSPDDSVSLLGANFFEGFLYTIDLDNNAIYLIKR